MLDIVDDDPNAFGPFYFANVPLLSAAIAVCCAEDDERRLFWEQPLRFCTDRYGLDAEKTEIMMAPKDNPPSADGLKFPTKRQLMDVADALIRELSAASPPAQKRSLPRPLDPPRAAQFPVLVALYRAFALGERPVPKTWPEDLQAELLGKADIAPAW